MLLKKVKKHAISQTGSRNQDSAYVALAHHPRDKGHGRNNDVSSIGA
jgi:hypothetical protein